jgi:molybdopterin-dependent oxidoreductase alpha subunit
VNAIHAMADGECEVFFCMGGNFLSAAPDTEFTAKALRKVALTVQVSTKLNRSHLVTGEEALILPCLGRTEKDLQTGGYQFVSVEDSMSVVHMSRGGLDPASLELLSEPGIISRLANATLGSDVVDWPHLSADYDRIRSLIEKVIPGFEDYNERVRNLDGFVLPNPPRDEQAFATPSGKAHFSVHDLPDTSVGEDRYVMMTIRSHDQYNTTIYGLDDRYRGVKGGRRVVLMNPEDMSERGIVKRQKVAIRSHFEGEIRSADDFAVIPYSIPRGNVATYFPEANVLIPSRSVAEKSNTPTSKWVVVSILT